MKEELSKLNDAKSVGLDGISPKLLRLGATAIAPSITWILNLSITTCTFADVWKVAKVVPIHKQGSVYLHHRNYLNDMCIFRSTIF